MNGLSMFKNEYNAGLLLLRILKEAQLHGRCSDVVAFDCRVVRWT